MMISQGVGWRGLFEVSLGFESSSGQLRLELDSKGLLQVVTWLCITE